MKKNTIFYSLLLTTSLLITACGKDPENTPSTEVKSVDDAGSVLGKNQQPPQYNKEDGTWNGDHFNAPLPYQRQGLKDDEPIGTPIMRVLAGEPQVATISQEFYQGFQTAQTDNPRFGWNLEQWSHVVYGTYNQLDPAIRNNTKLEPFLAFYDSQITTGGGLVDGQFVGDIDDVKQLEYMKRDAKKVEFSDPEWQAAYAVLLDWERIRDHDVLNQFKDKYRPRAVRSNENYAIPGEYSATIIDSTFRPFKEFKTIDNVYYNHNLIYGDIVTQSGNLAFTLIDEDGSWKMVHL